MIYNILKCSDIIMFNINLYYNMSVVKKYENLYWFI